MKSLGLAAALLITILSAPAYAQGADAYEAISKANDLARKGAVTRSIPFYEKGLKLDPLGYTLAYFNLAEVWRAKGRTSKAAFFYTLYVRHGSDETTLKQAKQALDELRTDSWGALTVMGTPAQEAKITIDGYLLADGEEIEALALPSGSYDIEVTAVDHMPAREEVKVASGETASMTYGLEEMTFFGTIQVKSNVPGATIKIHAGPSPDTRVLHESKGAMKESFKLEAGRHFVEITAPDYKRWIRNVTVSRDSDAVVEAELTRALPPEIRRDK